MSTNQPTSGYVYDEVVGEEEVTAKDRTGNGGLVPAGCLARGSFFIGQEPPLQEKAFHPQRLCTGQHPGGMGLSEDWDVELTVSS